MGSTVFAEGMGFFHKGSGGKGIAPGDVCLSPPPPPTGPVPVPYVNSLMASNLAKGSKSVKIQGEPTALEDKSEVSTSTGDEGGTQGGNVVTHKTKGKGYFKLWSFIVKIEGAGVCRHGDPMGQNCMSDPPGSVDMEALVDFVNLDWVDTSEPCEHVYDRDNVQSAPNAIQRAAVNQAGARCWQCFCPSPGGWPPSRPVPSTGFIPDHQPPMNIAWYAGGCHDPIVFRDWANQAATVRPHCVKCSGSQAGQVGAVSRLVSEIDNLSSHLKRLQRIMDWMPRPF